MSGNLFDHYGVPGEAGATSRVGEPLVSNTLSMATRKGADAVSAIGQRLDLDYAGVDFSVLPDGDVLVFEANATMLAHPEEEGGEFAYKNPFVERIFSAFQDLIAGASPTT